MIRKKITNKELDFILYIGRFQNDYGIATGVYYKDVCNAIGLSYQGFYDCKKSLEDKGIIRCEKLSYYDWDITIIDNNFKGKENYGRGYVSLHCNMVRSEEWKSCRVGAKLMGLLLLRDWKINQKKSGSSAFQILKENFIKKYKELFGVAPRMLRQYLSELQPFLDVYLEKTRKYYITFKKSAIEVRKEFFQITENEELRVHDVVVACRRNRIKKVAESMVKKVCKVLEQHHRQIENMLCYDLSRIVGKSLEVINQDNRNKYKWKRKLNVPLVHKMLVEEIVHVQV